MLNPKCYHNLYQGRTALITTLLRLKLRLREGKRPFLGGTPGFKQGGCSYHIRPPASRLTALAGRAAQGILRTLETDPSTKGHYATRSPHSESRCSVYHEGTKAREVLPGFSVRSGRSRFIFTFFDANLNALSNQLSSLVTNCSLGQKIMPHLFSKSYKHSFHSV